MNYIKRIALIILLSITFYSQAKDQEIFGYLPSFKFQDYHSSQINNLTHLILGFANPDSSGELIIDKAFNKYVDDARNKKIQVLMSLGGGGEYSYGRKYKIYQYLFKPKNRTEFVAKIIRYGKTHHLNGFDLNLEGKAIMLNNYEAFALELIDSCKANNMIHQLAKYQIRRNN